MEVFEKHPDMILNKSHFVSIKINWNDKITSLKEIANELNLGLDSLVFIDDSEFEINLVKKLLLSVKAILLPKDPSKYSDLLDSIGLFDTLTITEEDKKRTEMYQVEIERKKALNNIGSENIEDYYTYLEMEIILNKSNDFAIPRISQLTQKTNQFNFNMKRYSESEISSFSQSEMYDVYYLQLKDKFGDMGIVGVLIIKYENEEAIIDTFLLSCRVIGRGVEDVVLNLCKINSLKKKM